MNTSRQPFIFNLYLFSFLFLSALSSLNALDPGRSISQYKIQVWNVETGLPGNSICALQQTRDGYLWIGTQDGLVRFDGLNFESYTRTKIPQLKDNEIHALYEDRQGTLWIGTTAGGLTRYKQGEFFTYSTAEYNALNAISSIAADRRGSLWIASLTGGLTCKSGSTFTTYTTKEGLPDNQVKSIYKDGAGDLWVATDTGIVKVLGPGNFQRWDAKGLLPTLLTVCLYEEDTENFWIGTGEKGLFRFRDGSCKAFGSEAYIPHPCITCLYRDRSKNLWIGTDGGGLTRFSNGVFNTLPCGAVYSIYEDRESNLWVGTLDGGLLQLRDSRFSTLTTKEGLCHDYVNCTCEGRDGGLYIGTDGGLNLLKKGILTTLLTAGEELPDNSVECLFEDLAGNLWVGTWGGGLHKLKDGKLTALTAKDGLSDNSISCILGNSRGNLWIGTKNGLNRFDCVKNKFTVITTREGLASNFIRFIFAGSRGNLWVGSDAGLDCLKDGEITAYNPAAVIGEKHFRCAYRDNERTLWFGTHEGLTRMSELSRPGTSQNSKNTRVSPGVFFRGKEINLYTAACGLIENYVYAILEDEKGYLWLGGRKGISRIRKRDLEDLTAGKIDRVQPDSYDEKDGMVSRWCSGAGCKTREGRFWFPSTVGVVNIDPGNIVSNRIPPRILIEKFIVDGEPINIQTGSGVKETVELSPGKKRLQFYYTGLSFINPQKMKFKIKLAGYDKEWVDVGNVRSTPYTGLSAGHYTFKVKACNADGTWNEEGASLSFYLQPHFYHTPWFYLVVIVFIFAAVFSLHRFRIRQLRAREKEIRLEEMDKLKSRFFANISHEFRTPLTLIMGPLEQMASASREKEEQKKIDMMLRNSRRLLSLINQLLDLSKFESGRMKLSASLQNIVPFLKGITNSFTSLTAQNDLELTFHCEEKDITLYYDPEKIEKAVNNLLINAVKFTPPGGEIAVTVKTAAGPAPGHIEISVKDTGIGIPAGNLERIFDRFYQAEGLGNYSHKGTGIGLALTRELVKLHHGEVTVKSEEGQGSEFLIRLPSGTAHLKPGEIIDRAVKPHPLDKDAPSKTDDSSDQKFFGGISDESRSEIRVDALRPPYFGGDFSKKPPGRRRPEEPADKNIILVIDDDADVRSYIGGSLEPLYSIVEAKNGEEGLEKARKIIPDLIISDVMMPGIDGCQLCKLLKSDINTSHIPIILLTAKASEENVIAGLQTGADDYITKPFSTKILNARIRNLIDIRRQLQRNLNREMTLQPVKTSVSQLDKEFLRELQDAIGKNLADPEFNVDRLCKLLYISRVTLYRKILALSGESPTEFIRSLRLKKGAELLKSNFGTVLEVALEVGFSSANYFTRCFKKKFHQLPSEYQAAQAE